MIIPEVDRLEREVGSKYALVILAAKRARHLKEGATPMVRSASANPLTVALEEIRADTVRPANPGEEPVALSFKAALPSESAPEARDETE